MSEAEKVIIRRRLAMLNPPAALTPYDVQIGEEAWEVVTRLARERRCRFSEAADWLIRYAARKRTSDREAARRFQLRRQVLAKGGAKK